MLKQRKHKTFNYKPRFSKDSSFEQDMDDSKRADFVSKWRESKSTKLKSKGGMRLILLFLALVLLLICMFWLESKIS